MFRILYSVLFFVLYIGSSNAQLSESTPTTVHPLVCGGLEDIRECAYEEVFNFVSWEIHYEGCCLRGPFRKRPNIGEPMAVKCSFDIDEEGKMENIELTETFFDDFNEELSRVFNLMASKMEWEPAQQDHTNSTYNILLYFSVDYNYYEPLIGGKKWEPYFKAPDQIALLPNTSNKTEINELWDDYVATNKIFSKEAYKEKANGHLWISFVIDEQGQMNDIELINPIEFDVTLLFYSDKEYVNWLFYDDALRLAKEFSELYTWTPAQHKGKAVSTSYSFEIKYDYQEWKANKKQGKKKK